MGLPFFLFVFLFLLCGVGGNWTPDTRIFSPLLYQLSYRTKFLQEGIYRCKGCKNKYSAQTIKFFLGFYTYATALFEPEQMPTGV